jgi:hypothetical protein
MRGKFNVPNLSQFRQSDAAALKEKGIGAIGKKTKD